MRLLLNPLLESISKELTVSFYHHVEDVEDPGEPGRDYRPCEEHPWMRMTVES